MDTTQAAYRNVVRDFLVGRGLRDPEVKITQILRADLDGDGEDEVLLSATNYEAEENSAPSSAQAGNYSFVLLRQSRDGKVETKLVAGEFCKGGRDLQCPECSRRRGDSRPEWRRQNGTRFDESNYYEGGTTTVYRYTPSSIKTLLSVGLWRVTRRE